MAAAAAAAEAPAYSVVNQKGAGMLPPSAGDAAPVWQAIIEVGGGQQIVSTGRFYSCHSLPGVRAQARALSWQQQHCTSAPRLPGRRAALTRGCVAG